jgi:hypothetical protein
MPVRGRFGLRTDDNMGTEKGFDDHPSEVAYAVGEPEDLKLYLLPARSEEACGLQDCGYVAAIPRHVCSGYEW